MAGKKSKSVASKEESKEQVQTIIIREAELKNCSLLKAFGIAVLVTIVSFVVHTIESILTMDYYLDVNYFAVWSKLMMPVAGPPPMDFFLMSLAFGFITALIYIWAYKLVEPAFFMHESKLNRGLLYGVLLFAVTGIPFALSLLLMINMPAGLIAWWSAAGLVICLIDGVIIARFC